MLILCYRKPQRIHLDNHNKINPNIEFISENLMRKLVVANWKMNPVNVAEARQIFGAIEHRAALAANTQICICPPFLFIPLLFHHSHHVKLGSQDLSPFGAGAYTGEISAEQLKSWKVSFAIVGHSERRLNFSEDDDMVGQKIERALEAGIVPIICLGSATNAQKFDMVNLVTGQFNALTKNLKKQEMEKCIFVYEPSWAISTAKSPKPVSGEHAAELIDHVKTLMSKKIGKERAMTEKVLYGGTVNRYNVAQFAKYPQIGGALVGAASLDPDNFWEVIKEFNRESIHRS